MANIPNLDNILAQVAQQANGNGNSARDRFANFNVINAEGQFVASFGLLKTDVEALLPTFQQLFGLIGATLHEQGDGSSRPTPKLDTSKLAQLAGK